MEQVRSATPPEGTGDISIIHIVKQLYKEVYQMGSRLTKRDKLGVHAHVEHISREIISNIIKASLSTRTNKIIPLEEARVSLEVLKHMIRMEYELQIIDQKTYIRTEKLLVEISKMTNGWIKYITQNSTK